MRSWLMLFAALAFTCASLLEQACAWNQDHHHIKQLPLPFVHPVIVVGKIIIDEYQSPQDDHAIISIGGGGPQAAWGAAAALAVLTTQPLQPTYENNELEQQQQQQQQDATIPPKQPVMFFGPVGDMDWTETEDAALHALLGFAVTEIHPCRGPLLRTPRIRLWHDENENIQWNPLYDSFGEQGAQQLWNGRPTVNDILATMEAAAISMADCKMNQVVIGHAIMEAGAGSPGNGNDAIAFLDDQIRKRIHFLGIEPVVFPDEATGLISPLNAQTCLDRLERFGSCLNVVSPDAALFQAIQSSTSSLAKTWEWAIRNGAKGSRIMTAAGDEDDNRHDLLIPAATLETVDGKPINPTGAGNAYAAAFTTCRGNGLPPLQAASIASAIGAVMCEHHHIPPWNNQILARIHRAVNEVYTTASNNIPLDDGNLSYSQYHNRNSTCKLKIQN